MPLITAILAGCLQSFNGRLRDECLNETLFTSLHEARDVLRAWRSFYNRERPHSSLDNATPEGFRIKQQAMEQTTMPLAGINSADQNLTPELSL